MIPLETLYDTDEGSDLPLPPEPRNLYGSLRFLSRPGRPYVISNFVSTLDGVASLNVSGQAVGDVISGSNQDDSMVMGLLRAVSDVVMVGAGTLRASPQHIWTSGHVFPAHAGAYSELRARMGKEPSPLVVIVTAHGNIDMRLPMFHSDMVPVLIVTTAIGARRINRAEIPESVQVIEGGESSSLTAQEILKIVASVRPRSELILVEGGPHLLGDFFAERCLDELFLTLAPQVAGRVNSLERLGVVAEKIFTPGHPVWGKLVSVKRSGSHLFLRYAFTATAGMS